MNRKIYLLFILLLLTPLKTFASGGDVIMTMMIDVIVVLGLLIFIVCLKLKMKDKILLVFILFISECLSWISLGNIPYQKNAYLINTFSVIIPIISVIGVYLLNYKSIFSLKSADENGKQSM